MWRLCGGSGGRRRFLMHNTKTAFEGTCIAENGMALKSENHFLVKRRSGWLCEGLRGTDETVGMCMEYEYH